MIDSNVIHNLRKLKYVLITLRDAHYYPENKLEQLYSTLQDTLTIGEINYIMIHILNWKDTEVAHEIEKYLLIKRI